MEKLRRYGRESVRATGDYYKHRKGDDQRVVSSEAETEKKKTDEMLRAADCVQRFRKSTEYFDCCSKYSNFLWSNIVKNFRSIIDEKISETAVR